MTVNQERLMNSRILSIMILEDSVYGIRSNYSTLSAQSYSFLTGYQEELIELYNANHRVFA